MAVSSSQHGTAGRLHEGMRRTQHAGTALSDAAMQNNHASASTTPVAIYSVGSAPCQVRHTLSAPSFSVGGAWTTACFRYGQLASRLCRGPWCLAAPPLHCCSVVPAAC